MEPAGLQGPLVNEFGLEFRPIAGDSTGIIFEQEGVLILARFRVLGLGCRVYGLGFRVQGLGLGIVSRTNAEMLLGKI